MIEKITVINDLGHSLDLELMRPEKSGFIVKSITGLGASKTSVSTSDNSSEDGAHFNNAKIQKRNITLTLLFMATDTESIEEVRQKSYYYFSQKKPIELKIKTDNRHVRCTGYVESNEPNIFSKDSGCTITIVCPDPYFYALNNNGRVLTEFSSVESMMEFPFSNESLTENLITISEINTTFDALLNNAGDGEVGLILYIHAIGPAKGVNIYNIDTNEKMLIDTDKLEELTGKGITEGDTITICTLKGKKSMTLLRDGVTTNVLNCLKRESTWFTIRKGNNIFAYTTSEGANNLQFSIYHQLIYYGV